MASSPLSAASGPNPFSDLPFSSRAAFIWDHTSRSVIWLNEAARAKFQLGAAELQAAIPAPIIRRFAQCFDGARRKGRSAPAVTLKIGAHPALGCSLEVLELAGGHEGLIVAETAAAQALPEALCPPKRTAAKPAGARAAASKPTQKPRKFPSPVPQLTPEELRSFKAIGRKVRRLVQEKQRAGTAAPAAATPPPARQASASTGVQALPALLFSAFDLVLFLDKNLDIVSSEGRPQRFGHRKSTLPGKTAAQLFLAPEQAIFARMAQRLFDSPAAIHKDTLLLADGSSAGVPARAILGRWTDGGAHYFLGLLSLGLPPRLKRLQPQAVTLPRVTRLAA